jgi:hypothetical protein
MLSLLTLITLAGLASADDLAGVWTLEYYEMAGEEQGDVSGLLIMADGRFAMVYTMTTNGDALSGRAHAGRYGSSASELTFDVEQWVQHMDGQGSVVPPERVTAEIALEGDTLVLRFGSGSVQHWRRIRDTNVRQR